VIDCSGTGPSREDAMDISIVVFIIRIKKIIPNARLINSLSIYKILGWPIKKY
jgi:hypothetical protein